MKDRLTQAHFNLILDTYIEQIIAINDSNLGKKTKREVLQRYKNALGNMYSVNVNEFLDLVFKGFTEKKRACSGGASWRGYEKKEKASFCIFLEPIIEQLKMDFENAGALEYTGRYAAQNMTRSNQIELTYESVVKSSKNLPDTYFYFMLTCLSHPLVSILSLMALAFAPKKQASILSSFGMGVIGVSLGFNAYTLFSGKNQYLSPEVLLEDVQVKVVSA